MPVIVLALHYKDVKYKKKFLLFGVLTSAGVIKIFGSLLGPLFFLPMALYDDSPFLAIASAIVVAAIYMILSFVLLKVLVKQFIT